MWFRRLFGDSFGEDNVDEVITDIARAVDLGDARPEELGVVKHPRQLKLASVIPRLEEEGIHTVLFQLPF